MYPNNELRARVSAPVSVPRTDSGVLRPFLVNRKKLAIFDDLPVEAHRYPSCPWPRKGYGGVPSPKGFSVYARRQLARCGGVFAPASEGRLAFLTGTLPGGTPAAMEAISLHSSWVVHQLMTRIPRVIAQKSGESRWMWVWEWQKRGALHWHCVWECKDAETASLLLDVFKGVWCAVIDGLSKRSGVDCAERRDGGTWAGQYDAWRVDAQIGRKSPQNYLAKYLGKDDSKGGKVDAPYPNRWYGCSRKILQEMRDSLIVVDTHVGTSILSWVLTEDDVRILRTIEKVSDYTVAFCDKFKVGATVVFYPAMEEIEGVKEFLRGFGMHFQSGTQLWQKSVKARVPLPQRRSWLNIDQVGRYPRVQDRLYEDLGARQRAVLESYVMGQEVDQADIELIDNYAFRLLVNAGLLSPVIPLKRSGTGLTGDAPKKAWKGGGVVDENEYPGLPF
jgi:hypothetical protein